MQDLDGILSVQQWIKSYEGLKLEAYVDTTGHLTIGWGHNLADGITQGMAEFIFQEDFKQAVSELEQHDWYRIQPNHVKYALINMNFNIGIEKLLRFEDMILALTRKDYKRAAQAVLNSLWAKEVMERAKDIAVMISEGK